MSNPSTIFYNSLADAIATAQGTLFLDLNPYLWKTSVLNLVIIWSVANPCSAKVEFKYEEGLLNNASVTFDPPIKLFILGNMGAGLLSSVRYDKDGQLIELRIVPSTEIKPEARAKLENILIIRRNAADLFRGSLFGVLNSAVQVNDLFEVTTGPATIIQRVRYQAPDSEPGLAVDFKDQATITFSEAENHDPLNPLKKPTTFDNRIKIRKGGKVEIEEIDYFLDGQSLTCKLKSFNAVIEQGVISCPGLLFNLKSGAQIRFDKIDISGDSKKPAQVNASSGVLTGGLADGSHLSPTTKGPDPINLSFSSFALRDGSQTNIREFGLSLIDSSPNIFVGTGSTLKLNIFKGQIGFGKKSFFMFENTQLDARFSGLWGSATKSYALVQFGPFDFAGVTGEIEINTDSDLIISNGHVRSSDLAFDTTASPGAIGSFTVFDFDIAEDARLGLSPWFKIKAAAGGKFSGAQPAAPLYLKGGSDYPVGSVKLDLPFKEALIGKTLEDGKLTLNLRSDDNDNISGDGSLSGTIVYGVQRVPPLDSALSLKVSIDLSNMTISQPRNGQLKMTGNLRASAPPNLSIPITTPDVFQVKDVHGEVHSAFQEFSLKLICKLNQPLDIPATPFSFTNGIVSFDPITIRPAFQVIIPAGLGEHNPAFDPHSADGTHGPDEDRHRQEAITDLFPGCRVHFYLYEGGYDFQSEIKISSGNNYLTVDVLKFSNLSDIGFHQDGCEGILSDALAVVFTIGGLLGPIGAQIGDIVGNSSDDPLQNSINQFVAAKIVETLYYLKGRWR
jgi:hypothetical protein